MFDYDDSETGFLGFHLGSGRNRNEGFSSPGWTEDGEPDMSNLSDEEMAEWAEINESKGLPTCQEDYDRLEELLPLSELSEQCD